MATSEATICNIALSLIGSKGTIVNLQDETSNEATTCRIFYDTALAEMLRDFPWPFATKREVLSMVEEEPNDDWGFSYLYPPDSMFFRGIVSGADRTSTLSTRIQYDIEHSTTGTLIMTDQEEAVGIYTVLVDDPERYPHDFVMAFAFRLAAYIAPRLSRESTVGDLAQLMMQCWTMSLTKTRGNAFNEVRPGPPPESEIITSR